MNTIKVKTKETLETVTEIQIPKYFEHQYGNWFYRVDNENGRATRVFMSRISTSITNGLDLTKFDVDNCKEITEQEFKKVFCKAVAQIAGFDICEEPENIAHGFAQSEDIQEARVTDLRRSVGNQGEELEIEIFANPNQK